MEDDQLANEEPEVKDESAPVSGLAISEYNPVAAGLADLKHRFGNVVFDLSTSRGVKEARAARQELVRLRGNLEDMRKKLKAPALERAKLIDTEAKRIKDEILQLEDPIDVSIKADEERREKERQEREAAEAAARAELEAKLDRIRSLPVRAAGKGSVVIEALIGDLVSIEIDESYGEAQETAQALHLSAMSTLQTMLTDVVAAETLARQLHEERLALEAERKAQQEARLEQERQDAETRAAEEAVRAAAQKAEDDRLAAERRKAADEHRVRMEKEREELRKRQEELDRQAAEQAEVQRQAEAERMARAEVEAQERAHRQKQEESERAERLRIEEETRAFVRAWEDAIAEDKQRTEAAREQAKAKAKTAKTARIRQGFVDAMVLAQDIATFPEFPGPDPKTWHAVWTRASNISAVINEDPQP